MKLQRKGYDMSCNRIAFYLFYDEYGIVDDYILYKLEQLKKSVKTIFVVSNSDLDKKNRRKLETVADVVYCRENMGFDVWAYKEALELYGYERLNNYDELILMNYTFFGPIYPFEEMFDWSETKSVDFWGISDHKAIVPNPYTGEGELPRHIQSHFIAVRSNMFNSLEFKTYWETMPMITSYDKSVLMHESRFTNYFNSKGFEYDVYCNSTDYESHYPTFVDIKETLIKSRSPILKRRLFFHDPLFLDANCVDLKSTMNYIENNTSYDVNLIWDNILRSTEPRVLLTNAEHHKVFPDIQENAFSGEVKIAVIAHVYYPEMLLELEEKIDNIPVEFDLYITTASEESQKWLIEHLSVKRCNKVEVRIVEENRGRDISSLMITCKDVILTGNYDLILRIHSKKSSLSRKNNANYYKNHIYDNLLNSQGYVSNLLSFLENNRRVGICVPDLVHYGYPTLGHAWFSNKQKAKEIARMLDIKIKFDENTPHAAYGTMFWFRPEALRKLFLHEWKWADFEVEPCDADGTLADVIERLIVYTALDSGFLCYNISNLDSISKTYVKLEYKYQKIMSKLSDADVLHQCYNLDKNSDEIHSRDNEIQLLKLQHYKHITSLSWKLTAPLRRARRIITETLKR